MITRRSGLPEYLEPKARELLRKLIEIHKLAGRNKALVRACVEEAEFICDKLPHRTPGFRRSYLQSRGLTEPGHGDFGDFLYGHSPVYLEDVIRGFKVSVSRETGMVLLRSIAEDGGYSSPVEAGSVPLDADEKMWAAAMALVFPEGI